MVRPDETNIKSINDLVGKRIGAQIGTTGATKASSVKGADVKQYNNANEPFIELDNKGVDAVINDQPVVAYYLVNAAKARWSVTSWKLSTTVSPLKKETKRL